MATQVQLRRGNTSQTSAFTGAVAEITVDTDKETVVVHDGLTTGGFPLARESALSANLAFTQAAFNQANTANVTAEAGFAKANTANITAEAAFSKANSANVLAQAAFNQANTANVTAEAGFGRANSANILAQAAFNQANTANVTAQAAFDKANSVTQQGFVTVAANGINVVADANNDTLTISAANGVGITSNATTDTITFNLTPTGVTSGTYGSASIVPVFVVDAQGRLSSVTNTTIAISSSAVSGTFGFSSGGTNATSYTTGTLLVSNGTAIISLANTGTAATYANATHVPVITTDAYGRVSSVTNTAISFPVTSVAGVTGAVSNTQLINGIIAVDGTGSGLDADLLDGLQGTSYANATFTQSAFDRANTANITGDAAFSRANSANVLAQAAFDKANTDTTSISIIAGTYGNASAIPSITVTANGRISAITTEAFTAASIGDALALAIALG